MEQLSAADIDHELWKNQPNALVYDTSGWRMPVYRDRRYGLPFWQWRAKNVRTGADGGSGWALTERAAYRRADRAYRKASGR